MCSSDVLIEMFKNEYISKQLKNLKDIRERLLLIKNGLGILNYKGN